MKSKINVTYVIKNYKNFYKVCYHCHYTGKYRGAAHSICNLRYGTTKKIPVVFHNGSKYKNLKKKNLYKLLLGNGN